MQGDYVDKCDCRHGTGAVAGDLHIDLQAGGRKIKTGPGVGLLILSSDKPPSTKSQFLILPKESTN